MTQTIVIFSFVVFFTGLSALVKFFPPAKQNAVYGFRTGKSLASPESWTKANRLFGKLFFSYSLINAGLVTAIFMLFGNGPAVILYTAFSYVLVLIITAIRTNKNI